METYEKAKKVREIDLRLVEIDKEKNKLKTDKELLKAEITADMVANHDLKSMPFGDIIATRVFTKKVEYDDINKIISQLPEPQKELCFSYNKRFLESVIKENFRNSKKVMEGARLVDTEYLTVKPKEEKKEVQNEC